MDRVFNKSSFGTLASHFKSIKRTEIVKFVLLSCLIVLIAPIIENSLYLFSFNYVVYEDFVSWYFPVGFRVVCYLFFPLRYWPALAVGFTLGQISYVWYFYDVPLDDALYRLVSFACREFLILTPLLLAKLFKVRLDIQTVKSAVTVLFIAISYRFIRSMLIILPSDSQNKYRLIADEDRFEMMLAHQLGGIITTLIMLLFAFHAKTIYQQLNKLITKEVSTLLVQLCFCLTVFIGVYLFEPKSLYLLRMLAIFPLIWFSYRYGALGALSYASVTVISLLINVYGVNETELLLTTQLYIISYSVLALLLSAFVTELNKSKSALLEQNKELIELSTLTQNLATKVVNVQESERSQLSQELHDDIGQNLTALKTNIAILEKKTANHNELASTITRLQNVSSHMYDSVYRLMHWLRPRLLDELGLEAALKSELFSEHLNEAGIAYQCKISGPIDNLNDDFKIAIFRICQEASTNAVKHSLATEFSIDITYLQNKLEVIINDNGIGLSAQLNSNSKGGFGVLGIVERVSVLNGKTQFKNGEFGGLTIMINFTTTHNGYYAVAIN
ncbi:MASE1 domain-containing protein [Pseudoalteromonas sp. SCSIO 43101]|uniref:MASE1 domain-containing protein n=1 Tax=Pseudoalteromonas sp. SCSIO 43101 TaxID=2822847 RepID=UPI00202B7557|nr:MASE1 domain-containing protein [Pseudoalteromonas sp. SCSIO 43101]URQ89916.1 MASE1 domain-containing protein [Pseudoalteromonas sp. SCSIO 43101]